MWLSGSVRGVWVARDSAFQPQSPVLVGPLRWAGTCGSEGVGQDRRLLWGLGGMLSQRLDQAGLGRAGLDRSGLGRLGRQGRLTWLQLRGSSFRSGPGPGSLAAPAAGASSGSGSAAIYGAWMGRGGGSTSSPHPLQRTVGREKREGAGPLSGREPPNWGRRMGWGRLRGRTPTDTVTHIFPFTPHPHPASQRCTHRGCACAHTFMLGTTETRTHDSQAHTYLDTHRRQHVNSL